MVPVAHFLNYAQKNVFKRDRRRIAILSGTGIAMLLLAGPQVIRRVKYALSVHHAMDYVAPVDAVVLRELPPNSSGSANRSSSPVIIVKSPASLPWGELGSVAPSSTIVFLHSRTAGGKSWLVEVESSGSMEFSDEGQVVPLRPKIRSYSGNGMDFATDLVWIIRDPQFQHGNPIQLFAGQPDPSDQSHFVIKYQSPQKTGFIDGWLHEDGSVTFNQNTMPATSQAGSGN